MVDLPCTEFASSPRRRRISHSPASAECIHRAQKRSATRSSWQ